MSHYLELFHSSKNNINHELLGLHQNIHFLAALIFSRCVWKRNHAFPPRAVCQRVERYHSNLHIEKRKFNILVHMTERIYYQEKLQGKSLILINRSGCSKCLGSCLGQPARVTDSFLYKLRYQQMNITLTCSVETQYFQHKTMIQKSYHNFPIQSCTRIISELLGCIFLQIHNFLDENKISTEYRLQLDGLDDQHHT
jgi:hypothetical protein